MQKNISMINLVKDELENLLNHAEALIRVFAETGTQNSLSESIEDFKQIVGTAKILDLVAADLLALELIELVQYLQQNAQDSGKMPRILDGLMLGMTLLHRYFNYVKHMGQSLPELLLPTINELRLIRSVAALPDSLFFDFERAAHVNELRSLVKTARSALPDQADLRRLRHMYQVGLLEIIRDNEGGFRLMKRALDRVEAICGDTPVAEIWPLAQTAVEAMVMGDVALTRSRKLLFAWLDRELKLLSVEGERYLESAPSAELVKELCYLIAISTEGSANIKAKKAALKLSRAVHSDAALQLERQYMSGPDGSVIHAVAVAVIEELAKLKDKVDAQCRQSNIDAQGEIQTLLDGVAQTLLVLDLNELAEEIHTVLRHLHEAEASAESDPMKRYEPVVDLIMLIENQVSVLLKAGRIDRNVPDSLKAKEKIPLSIVDEVRLIVLNESRTALAQVKQSLTSYMDSGWDVLHLNTVPAALHSVWGVLHFLKIDRAAGIILQTENCIQNRFLAENPDQPTENEIETLADVITGVDYYLESMVMDKPFGVGILEVAEEGLALLAYPVSH